LAQSFIDYTSPRIGSAVQSITEEAIDLLCSYDWPGNVRELFNVLERAMLLCENDMIAAEDLPLYIAAVNATGEGVVSGNGLPTESMKLSADWLEKPLKDVRKEIYEQAERKYLSHLLQATHGKVGLVAKQAGINKRALYTKMKRYGFSKEDYR
jgi:DNA-binding NtrC family response regulator